MTHGVLVIIDGERKIYLHTCHTGQDIPNAVGLAIDVVVSHWLSVIERHLRDDESVEESVREFVGCGSVSEVFEYGKSLAAAIIAAKPLFLEPVFPEYQDDLPDWSGMDHPFILRIVKGYGEFETRWVLTDEEGGEIMNIEPTEVFIERAVVAISRR